MAKNVNQIANLLNDMSEEDLRQLNHIIVEKINARIAMKRQQIKAQFYTGQPVTFEAKGGRKVNAKITKINSKNIQCDEILPAGSKGMPIKWTVSPNLLKPA